MVTLYIWLVAPIITSPIFWKGSSFLKGPQPWRFFYSYIYTISIIVVIVLIELLNKNLALNINLENNKAEAEASIFFICVTILSSIMLMESSSGFYIVVRTKYTTFLYTAVKRWLRTLVSTFDPLVGSIVFLLFTECGLCRSSGQSSDLVDHKKHLLLERLFGLKSETTFKDWVAFLCSSIDSPTFLSIAIYVVLLASHLLLFLALRFIVWEEYKNKNNPTLIENSIYFLFFAAKLLTLIGICIQLILLSKMLVCKSTILFPLFLFTLLFVGTRESFEREYSDFSKNIQGLIDPF